MGTRRNLRKGRLVALGGAVATLTAVLLGWQFGTPQADAHTPHPGLNFTLTAVGQDCDSSQGDAVCYIDPGTTFTLNITLDALGEGITQYEAFDIVIEYTGLTSADNATTESWPDCGFPAVFYEPGRLAMGCAIGIPPAEPSTYTGLLGTNDFTCEESGQIILRHGPGTTVLVETLGLDHAERQGIDALDITCGEPPTATATAPAPTALPPVGSGTGQGDGANSGLWAAIAALLALSVVGLSALGWTLARSR